MATTTNYGWETPDDTDLVKDGALAQRTTANSIDSTLGTALNNKLHAGLVLIKTQTIGTAVASVTVTSAFSSAYDNYRIVFNNVNASTQDQQIRITVNGSSSFSGGISALNLVSGAISGGTLANSAAGVPMFLTSTDGMSFSCDVLSPFSSGRTWFNAGTSTGYNFVVTGSAGYSANAGSSTSFTIIAASGTLTGGTIAVYGYAKD